MNAGPPAVETSMVELEIMDRIAAAKIRLRFDKSVVRLINSLKVALAEVVPEGQAVIFTVTAPIKRRVKTAAALEILVRSGLPSGEVRNTIQDNHVRVRRVTNVAAHMPKVVGFVHNPESDSDFILKLAESQLLGRN
ncbi:hypothetical protein E0H51_11600 [Rhizobium leguminosarum bv. viciae]|jgi:hypothetical protein|uniref:hypothetical protein n=1 Tax=Rhizobium TaxID=379 RepID=UPI00037E4D9B|nr:MULTISPECIES: hypothetical protein [Rhizobium]MBY5751129.1 hypothetical protein [Rhizobium leguminosarum]MBY5798031.1 hypothetical protein [Rhizobium leguminosarum]MBY5823875.1 hypothetical protein [Rhizobium leguminosarum]NKK76170.1 hypothetical protein [Rhizobium leguminosarum bv. viciae]NKN00027.1 hypothetical protein [Rhizobium leguminosarum bv. viciae]